MRKYLFILGFNLLNCPVFEHFSDGRKKWFYNHIYIIIYIYIYICVCVCVCVCVRARARTRVSEETKNPPFIYMDTKWITLFTSSYLMSKKTKEKYVHKH